MPNRTILIPYSRLSTPHVLAGKNRLARGLATPIRPTSTLYSLPPRLLYSPELELAAKQLEDQWRNRPSQRTSVGNRLRALRREIRARRGS